MRCFAVMGSVVEGGYTFNRSSYELRFFARDAYKASTYKQGAINAFLIVTSVAAEYQSAFDQATSMYGANLNIAGHGDAVRKSLDVSKWDAEKWGYVAGSLSISIFGPPIAKAAGGFALGQLGRAGGFVF